jgi:hypothetical protein
VESTVLAASSGRNDPRNAIPNKSEIKPDLTDGKLFIELADYPTTRWLPIRPGLKSGSGERAGTVRGLTEKRVRTIWVSMDF